MSNIDTTISESVKNDWNYERMNLLFEETSKYWISKKEFIDRFLEIYKEVEFKIKNLLLRGIYLDTKICYDRFFSLAIKKIIELEKGSEEKLNFSIFCSPKTNQFWEDPEHFREVPKYEIFLKLLYKKYWLRLEWVEIKTYIETLEPNIINLPYRIITIKTKSISRTILINNQIWEGTYIYKWIIEPDFLSSINKWDMVNGDFPISIKYFDKYESNLEILFDNNFLLSWLKLLDYDNSEHIEILLWRITDKNWYTVEVDLRNILTSNFSRLYFWDWTVFWRLLWQSILVKTWWRNRIYLKKLLEVWWISRPDLPSMELDCKNPKHIKKLLSKITDKYWNKIDVNLKAIWVKSFERLYFWYWTEFWMLSWQTLLKNNWLKSSKALKNILESSWISRPDLAKEELDIEDPEHIKILLSNITESNWDKVEIDLKTIKIWIFTELCFWYSTEFWKVRWTKILEGNWWINNKTLIKILWYYWIKRLDLGIKWIDYKNSRDIKILLSSITDKDWNKVEVDLKTIWVRAFSNLNFWYWTEFWIIGWYRILKNNLWQNNKSLKKILDAWWISRSDL